MIDQICDIFLIVGQHFRAKISIFEQKLRSLTKLNFQSLVKISIFIRKFEHSYFIKARQHF